MYGVPHLTSPVQPLLSIAAAAILRVAVRVLSRECLVQHVVRRQVDHDSVVLDLHVKCGHVEASVADTLPGIQVVGVLVDRASDLWSVASHAYEAAREHLQLLVRAGVLRGVPPVGAGIVVDGELRLADLHSKAGVAPEVGLGAHVHPVPGVVRHLLADLCRADDCGQVLHLNLHLLALLGPLEVAVLLVVYIGKLAEARPKRRGVDHLLPLALIGIDLALHARIKLLAEAQLVVHNNLMHVLDAALQVLQPLGRPR
mmetsp:Transcript_80503/g.213721  ORF Transcript_80503/g.213721 Transcript_80503/m.213721 type:complete len:257 (+) Transcript_80503:128-898(+)